MSRYSGLYVWVRVGGWTQVVIRGSISVKGMSNSCLKNGSVNPCCYGGVIVSFFSRTSPSDDDAPCDRYRFVRCDTETAVRCLVGSFFWPSCNLVQHDAHPANLATIMSQRNITCLHRWVRESSPKTPSFLTQTL